jgi:hypothetical protein
MSKFIPIHNTTSIIISFSHNIHHSEVHPFGEKENVEQQSERHIVPPLSFHHTQATTTVEMASGILSEK